MGMFWLLCVPARVGRVCARFGGGLGRREGATKLLAQSGSELNEVIPTNPVWYGMVDVCGGLLAAETPTSGFG